MSDVDWNCPDHPNSTTSEYEVPKSDLVKIVCDHCGDARLTSKLEFHEARCQQCEDVFEPPPEEAHLFCEDCRDED
jgi:hypothetical protein